MVERPHGTVASVPEITVLLTCYNFRPYLQEAVRSVLTQNTARQLELIVIDDASPDRSFEVLAEVDDPRLTLIVHQENQGFARSITEGFWRARGKYFCRWDGDDRWPNDAVEHLANALDAHPNAVLAYGEIQLLSTDGEISDCPISRPAGPNERDEFAFLLNKHYTCAPAMMGRRDAWQKLMPWQDERIDWFYNLHLARLGPFVYVDHVVAHYRTHANGHHVASLQNGAAERHLALILHEFAPLVDSRTRKRIIAQNYLSLALAYFGMARAADARRCFALVWRNLPGLLINRHCIGPLLACYVLGISRYGRLKSWLKRGRS